MSERIDPSAVETEPGFQAESAKINERYRRVEALAGHIVSALASDPSSDHELIVMRSVSIAVRTVSEIDRRRAEALLPAAERAMARLEYRRDNS